MKTMKKTVSVALALVLALSLAACGWGEEGGGFGMGRKEGEEQTSSDAGNRGSGGTKDASGEKAGSEEGQPSDKDEGTSRPQDGVVHIKTAEQLMEFADRINNGEDKTLSAVLDEDIDMSSVCGASLGSWIPIRGLKGDFDGGGHTISNLYCVQAKSAAMFVEPKGNMKDLSLKDVVIESTEGSAAGLVISLSGTIENCQVSGSVKGYDRAGGIATDTYRESAVLKCVNEARVEGGHMEDGKYKGNVAGIAAWPRVGGRIQECVNRGEIIGAGYDAGGIVGSCEEGNILVEDCINEGDVHGGYRAGGIAGLTGKNTVTNRCVNNGRVYGAEIVSGIAGASNHVLLNCANHGDLEVPDTEQYFGVGIFGISKKSLNGMVNCYNTGNITCGKNADIAVFGYSPSAMCMNLYSYGNVVIDADKGLLPSDCDLWNIWAREGCVITPEGFNQSDIHIKYFRAETDFSDGTVLEELNKAVEGFNSDKPEDLGNAAPFVTKLKEQGEFELSKWVAGSDGLPRFEWE